MFLVYILKSVKAESYYVGQTDNLERRIQEHNFLSTDSYTSKFRPWEIVAQINCGDTRGDALKVERYIKRQKRKAFIQIVIEKQQDEDFLQWLRNKANQ